MSERKVNLKAIVKTEFEKYPDDHIDIKSIAGVLLLQKIIADCMKEACRQVLELAAENATAMMFSGYEGDDPYVSVNDESITNTINQVE